MLARSPRLAFDYASSSRSIDLDGRLHVRSVNLTRACVNDYYGREIPDADRLGLDASRLYALLRDPAELEKAVSTFNALPVLSRHVPVSANDHQPSLVVGSTGTKATFDGVYLKNSMVVWSAPAIMAIDSGEQRELSCGYRYVAIMQPGIFKGVRYDGRMTNISANHLALVGEGRVGRDCVVGDGVPAGVYERWAREVRRINVA